MHSTITRDAWSMNLSNHALYFHVLLFDLSLFPNSICQTYL